MIKVGTIWCLKQTGVFVDLVKRRWLILQECLIFQSSIIWKVTRLKKYVDDVNIAVVVWGPGIHLLAKHPQRPVPPLFQQRVRSMAESYGVRFIACGNTMHSLNWSKADMLDIAEIQDVGAAAIMELQEQGHAYLAW